MAPLAPMLIPERGMTHPTEVNLVRWEFERDRRHLACAVSFDPDTPDYEVAMVPLWAGGSPAVERFATPCDALHRHAAIVADLREAGWTLSSYTDVHRSNH
jgi:hypothetical protein